MVQQLIIYLCLKYDTQGQKYLYNDLLNIFSEILPSDWDDLKYDEIYVQAKHYLIGFEKAEKFLCKAYFDAYSGSNDK